MNAPLLWIAFPLAVSLVLFLLPRERWISVLGSLTFFGLSAIAFFVPTDTALRILDVSIRIDSTLVLFGRQISLPPSDQTILVLVFGMGAFWFFGTIATSDARRLVPTGMIVLTLLVASLAVRPFLYAALLIEIAVLLSIPLLISPGQKPGRGVIRFLIYQTLAMPFILFSGFLLSGIEASPGDVALVTQSALLLGMGFAFLLAIFPLYTWLPMLAEESQPYVVGFIALAFPLFGLLFGLNFIDQYSWLREAPLLSTVLRLVGLLMLVTSGIWAAFQRHLGRIMAYAAASEIGISLLALSLANRAVGLQALFFLMVPRALAFGVWAMAIGIFKRDVPGLKFTDLRGLARRYPVATAALVLANLSLSGMPLLATFPARQALWENLAAESFASAIWLGLSSLGLWFVAIRSLAVLSLAPENEPWRSNETWEQRILMSLGMLTMLILGIFPQLAQPLLLSLPYMFEHLGK